MKWEYCYLNEEVHEASLESLNELGENGWELVHIVTTWDKINDTGGKSWSSTFWFKRPKD